MIASIWGREAGGAPSYNVAKAAEISLAKAMAGDLAKDGIRVFSVAPGSTLFPGGSWERRLRDDPEGMAAFIERELPWGRLGTVDEIADAVTFLVSPRASWVVGTCVSVDGGQSRSFCSAAVRDGPESGRRDYPPVAWDSQAAPRSRSSSACARTRRRGCRRSPSARSRRAAGPSAEEPCGVRTPFQRDRDRLVHSKPFRRLKGKTQVFIDPEGDHYRTRMTHTLETTAISRVVARALRLNEDLVEAIGLGHDTGHTPFGHAGEQALDDALNAAFGRRFRHNEQSWRIARRLNLTHEVCDGILTHTGAQEPETLEGKIVRIVDRVAYINHDIDDAIRYGILSDADLPRDEIELLGATGSERIDRLVHDLVDTSERGGRHSPERRDRRGDALAPRVHVRPRLPRPAGRAGAPSRARRRAGDLRPARRRSRTCSPPGDGELADRITDYVSGMTDRFALAYAGRP